MLIVAPSGRIKRVMSSSTPLLSSALIVTGNAAADDDVAKAVATGSAIFL
jgi:hypothetical protein